MATLTIRNFPDDLYAQLERRAQLNHRRLDDELEEAARVMVGDASTSLTSSEKLAMADCARQATPDAWITEEFIRQAREEGRS